MLSIFIPLYYIYKRESFQQRTGASSPTSVNISVYARMKNCIAFILIATAGLCSGVMLEPITPKPDEVLDECWLTCSRTILHHAVEMANVRRVWELLKGGKNMYATDCNGLTPMHYAIKSKTNNTDELILAFINNEFDVYKQFGDHSQILFYAIKHGSYEAVETLVTHGVPYMGENEDFLQPIQVAIQHNREDVARLFMKLATKDSKNLISTYGHNMIMKAIETGRVEEIEMIIRLGFDKNILKGSLQYIEKAVEVDRPSMVNMLIKYSWWPTCYATWPSVIVKAKSGNKKAALNAINKNLEDFGCLKQLSPEKWESIPHPNATDNATANA